MPVLLPLRPGGNMNTNLCIVMACAAIALQGCAWSTDGLDEAAVEGYYVSSKKPRELAQCIAGHLGGRNSIAKYGDHLSVARLDTSEMPVARWDVHPTHAGSRVEVRRIEATASGEEAAAACL